jgi:hypothetical protein
MLAQSVAGGAQPVILACNLPVQAVAGAAVVPPAERVFRVAPGSFQEWDARKQAFGENFCAAFACAKTPGRMEGNISSASVSYTVGVVSGTSEGYWRATGASGLAAKQGACRIVAAPPSSRAP